MPVISKGLFPSRILKKPAACSNVFSPNPFILKSDFFVAIRENKKLLENNDSACSLALKVKELEQLKNRKFDS
jgi:hypothetical protein